MNQKTKLELPVLDDVDLKNTNSKINGLITKLRGIVSDYIGITSSILCLIHCLGLPFLFFIAQYFGFNLFSGLAEEIEHIWFFDAVFLLTASIAVYFALKHAHSKNIKILLSAGWVFFAIGVLLEHNEYLHYAIHLGSVLLIIGHVQNIRLCRSGSCEI